MEKKLQALFDFHRFERSPKLEAMIADTEARFDAALSDDALETVAAAGEMEVANGKDFGTWRTMSKENF